MKHLLSFETNRLPLRAALVGVIVAAGIILSAQATGPAARSGSGRSTTGQSKTAATKAAALAAKPLAAATKATTAVNAGSADSQALAAAKSQPVTAACNLLTLAVARRLLGSTAAAAAPDDTSALQATDTTVSACAYIGESSRVQLVIRAPTGSLGISENDLEFGSGKPDQAIKETGYGQAAYWEPDNQTLNVLGNNNWYIISRTPASQPGSKAVAQTISAGF